jgi:hypothetical protein
MTENNNNNNNSYYYYYYYHQHHHNFGLILSVALVLYTLIMLAVVKQSEKGTELFTIPSSMVLIFV